MNAPDLFADLSWEEPAPGPARPGRPRPVRRYGVGRRLAARPAPTGPVVVTSASYNPDHACDSRCTFARGPSCSCSCAGANHGRGWAGPTLS